MTRHAALWSSGFRPFFLLGAAYGPLAVAYWLVVRSPPFWHAHEMVYGFAVAIVCGVLLTALPSWAGAAELRGAPLAVLAGIWLLARLAMLAGEAAPRPLALILDVMLLASLCAMLVPSLGGARWRLFAWTLPPLAALAAGNAVFHLATAREDYESARWGVMLGLHALAFLYSLYGGLLTPAFTRTWLRSRGERAATIHVPLEYLTAAAMLAFAVADLAGAPPAWMAAAAFAACAVHVVRAARWRGWRTASEPLLWPLHLGYLWFIAMFALRGLAELTAAAPPEAWIHAFALGALGMTMTSLMTRVALRHTGRPLAVAAPMRLAFVLVFAAALARLAYAMLAPAGWLIVAAALAWSAAFAVYLACYGAALWRPSLPRR